MVAQAAKLYEEKKNFKIDSIWMMQMYVFASQGLMWRRWQPQMQMTLPMETVPEWSTASSMASHTSLLIPRQVNKIGNVSQKWV